MNENKASKIRFYWIAFMTGIYTFYYSSKVVIGSFLQKNSRTLVDRAMFKWATALLSLVRVTVKVEGKDKFPSNQERPIIVMCNHSSLYDIPISAVALNTSLRMLAKKELFKIPVFSAALRRGEFISIDRHNREQAFKDLSYAKEKMLDGIVLWVAPEGTRSKDGKLGSFKRGAFHIALDTGALIVPLVVKNVHEVQAGKDLSLTLNQTVNVEIGEVVDASKFQDENRKELVNKVRESMLKILNQSEEAYNE